MSVTDAGQGVFFESSMRSPEDDWKRYTDYAVHRLD